MDSVIGQSPKIPNLRPGPAKMVPNFSYDVIRVRYLRAKRKAMSIAVPFRSSSYHNHLDKDIVNAQWLGEE